MQVLVRSGKAWLDADGRWRSAPIPADATSNGTLSAAAFQQLARFVKDVRVKEHQVIQGQTVAIDLSKLGLDIGDIHAVLTVDEQTHLLDSAGQLRDEGRGHERQARPALSPVRREQAGHAAFTVRLATTLGA